MPDHYETLGVPRDADVGEIRKAFQKKARENHPDKGGKNGDMTAINKAWATLKDPDSRRNYDATGQDKGPAQSREQRIQNLVMMVFSEVLQKDVRSNSKGYCLNLLNTKRQEILHVQSGIKDKLKALESWRKRVRVKAKTNAFLMVIDQQIQMCRLQLESLQQDLELMDAAILEVGLYEFDEDGVPQPPLNRSFFVTFTDSSAV
jgi:curved DNA-binding protein CbpA